MALQRRLILKQALDRGFGTSTIPADAGGYLVGDKIGIHSFLGNAYISVEDLPGSNFSDKAINAIAALPSTGGVVDGRSLYGAQTINADFFSGVTKPVMLLLGMGTYTTTAAITVPSNCYIIGCGSSTSGTVIKGSGSLASVLDGTNKTGVVIRDLTINGNGTCLNGITIDNTTTGASTTNEIRGVRVLNTTTKGIAMNHNGDTTIENVVLSVTSGVAIYADNRGGNIMFRNVVCPENGNKIQVCFQTCLFDSCDVAGIEIIGTNADQLVLENCYIYSATGGGGVTTSSTFYIRQLDAIGTRFVMEQASETAINCKVVHAIFLTDPLFDDPNSTTPNVFGATAAANSGSIPLFLFGGAVTTSPSAPVWNPPGSFLVVYENFVAGSGDTRNYRHFGSVGNDGSTTLFITPPSTSTIPVIQRGLAAQTADLHQWQNSAGTVLAQISAAGSITSAGYVVSSSATLGVGYAAGAGGTQTQSTSKSTGVTLNKVTGTITMNNATLNSATSVGFTLANTTIAATDVVLVSIKSGATADSYSVTVDATTAGSCRISLRNVSGGNLGEAVVLSFVVIKGVAA